jgi:hypothetical protein
MDVLPKVNFIARLDGFHLVLGQIQKQTSRGAFVQILQFLWVDVNGDVPFGQQIFDRVAMVEVAVGDERAFHRVSVFFGRPHRRGPVPRRGPRSRTCLTSVSPTR